MKKKLTNPHPKQERREQQKKYQKKQNTGKVYKQGEKMKDTTTDAAAP